MRLRTIFFIRIVIVITFLICGISNSVDGWAVQKKEASCVYDGFFDSTASLNTYFNDNDSVRNYFLIACSLTTDVLFLFFIIRYLSWGTSSKQFIFFMLFYPLVGIAQLIFRIRVPEGYCWDSPGFPSLIMSYNRSSSFYYSTYSGILVFLALENYQNRNKTLFWISVITCIVLSVLTVLTRADYTVSLIGGMIMAHYFWIVSDRFAEGIDPLIGIIKN